MTDAANEDATAEVERLEDELDDARDEEARSDNRELPEPAPEVARLYVELRDLDAKGTSNAFETGRKIAELVEAGETGRDIAKRSAVYNIEGCTSQPTVVRMYQFASVVAAGLEQIEGFTVPAEYSIRPLCRDKNPSGEAWSLSERMEFLISAVKLADSEGKRLNREHVKAALAQRWPPTARETLRDGTTKDVRKLLTTLERTARDSGLSPAAMLRACQLYIDKHGAESEPADTESVSEEF